MWTNRILKKENIFKLEKNGKLLILKLILKKEMTETKSRNLKSINRNNLIKYRLLYSNYKTRIQEIVTYDNYLALY